MEANGQSSGPASSAAPSAPGVAEAARRAPPPRSFLAMGGSRPWVWAGALALALHLAWFLVLSPSPPVSPRAVPLVPRLSYLPPLAAGDVRALGALALGSPALFSLPTPMGFSRPAMARVIGARPPLEIPPDEATWQPRQRPGATEPAIPPPETLEQLAAASLNSRPPAGLPRTAASAEGAEGVGGIRVELSAGLEGLAFEREEWADGAAVRPDRSWEAVARVETDPQGRVAHVFLETPTELPGLNAALVRSLRSWRLKDSPGPHSGRVTFRYAGPAPAEAASPEGTP